MTDKLVERLKAAMSPLVNEQMDPAMRDAWLTDLALAVLEFLTPRPQTSDLEQRAKVLADRCRSAASGLNYDYTEERTAMGALDEAANMLDTLTKTHASSEAPQDRQLGPQVRPLSEAFSGFQMLRDTFAPALEQRLLASTPTISLRSEGEWHIVEMVFDDRGDAENAYDLLLFREAPQDGASQEDGRP